MTYSDELSEVMTRVLAGMSPRRAAAQIGCDATLLWSMQRHGRVPRRETLIRIADGLQLAGSLREELFAASGYLERPRRKECVVGASR